MSSDFNKNQGLTENIKEKTKSQDVISKCETIINEISSNQKKELTENRKGLNAKTSVESTKTNATKENKLKTNQNVFSNSFFTTNTPFTERKLKDDSIIKKDKQTKENLDRLVEEFQKTLDDSFDAELDEEVTNLSTSLEKYKNEFANLPNRNMYSLKAIDEENSDSNSVKSDEIFDLEEDVVESTPQKEKSCSQRFLNKNLSVNFPPLIDSPDVITSECMDISLPPPLEFQDPIMNDNENKSGKSSFVVNTCSENNLNKKIGSETDIYSNPLTSFNTNEIIDSSTPNSQRGKFPSSLSPIKKLAIEKDPIDEKNCAIFENNFIVDYYAKKQIIEKRQIVKKLENEKCLNYSEKTPLKPQNIKLLKMEISQNKSPNIEKSLNLLAKNYNPIEIAQNAKYSPLTVVPSTPLQKLITPSSITKQKSILNYVKNSQNDTNSSIKERDLCITPNKKPCIACTRIPKEQVIAISSMTNKKLATYSNIFNSSVTHMVVVVNDKNCIKDYTMKFVLAVASGLWVVNIHWVQECLNQNQIIPEVYLVFIF